MSNLLAFNKFISLPRTQEYLDRVLGEKRSSFIANLTSLVSNSANLQACEPVTLMYAAMSATALDLPLDKNLGYAFVVPYYNGKTRATEAQFQIGTKGLQQLAMRTSLYTKINITDVREGELAGRNRLTGDIFFNWIEDDAERLNKPIIGYVAYFKLQNGFSKLLYMSVEEITAHASRYSQTFKSEKTKARSLWTTDFNAMAKKTVIKLLLNDGTAPKSVEMSTALKADQAVQHEQGIYEYADNSQDDAKTKLSGIAAANAGVTQEDTPEPYTEEADFEPQPDG